MLFFHLRGVKTVSNYFSLKSLKPNKWLSFVAKYRLLFISPSPIFFFNLKIFNTLLSSSFSSGDDIPSNEKFQMYPQDRVVPVGGNTTFCCIVEEGKRFGTILSGNTDMKTTRLSRRSYATTVVNQKPSGRTGTNIICYDDLKTKLTGAVVFVGCKTINDWIRTEVWMAVICTIGKYDWNGRERVRNEKWLMSLKGSI